MRKLTLITLALNIVVVLIVTTAFTAQAAPSSFSKPTGPMAIATEKIAAKNYESAIEELKAIVANDQSNADAYNLLGYSHRKLKRYDQALTYYQQALNLNPNHLGAMEYLGELYVETDQLEKAEQMLARLDDACFFLCSEYRTLKKKIQQKSAGEVVSSEW